MPAALRFARLLCRALGAAMVECSAGEEPVILPGGDAAVFAATQMWVSGHSLKHVVAAAAALPLVMALRPRRVGREGTIASLPLRAAKAFNIQRGSAR